jgi:hypothetical protein
MLVHLRSGFGLSVTATVPPIGLGSSIDRTRFSPIGTATVPLHRKPAKAPVPLTFETEVTN